MPRLMNEHVEEHSFCKAMFLSEFHDSLTFLSKPISKILERNLAKQKNLKKIQLFN